MLTLSVLEIDLVQWHLQMPTLSGEITVMELLQKRNHDMNIDVLCGEVVCVCVGGGTRTEVYYHCSIVKRKEMFYLTTHSTHFIYGYMASDIW